MTTHNPNVMTKVEVTCARSATVEGAGDVGQYEDVGCVTLADLEAFCATLRQVGCGDDQQLPGVGPLSVIVERPTRL